MMSLVQYDLSDESDENESVDPNEEASDINTEVKHPSNLFTSLPQPKRAVLPNIIEEEVVPYNSQREDVNTGAKMDNNSKSKTVKIAIPSLTDFQNDDDDAETNEPPTKKTKAQKGSGLFSILPPPKQVLVTTKTFVPNVLTTKRNVNKKSVIVNKSVKKPTVESDDEFTNLPDTFDDDTWQKVCGRKKKKPAIAPVSTEIVTNETKSIELAPVIEKNEDMLDNKAFKELVGKAKKPVNVKLIDINEEEILPEKDVWMTKSLTDPACAPKYEVTDPVNNTCKKKHHITYLVQQAKANEQDLKNQWAANRFTRKQTQAKYGF